MHGFAFDQDRVGQISSRLMFGENSLHEFRAGQTQVLDFHAGVSFLKNIFKQDHLGGIKTGVDQDLPFFAGALVKTRVG
jgi:hypothetical protein